MIILACNFDNNFKHSVAGAAAKLVFKSHCMEKVGGSDLELNQSHLWHNGASTATQHELGIPDSAKIFF